MPRRFALVGALHSCARLACVRMQNALLDASASAQPFSPAAREGVGCGDEDHHSGGEGGKEEERGGREGGRERGGEGEWERKGIHSHDRMPTERSTLKTR